MATKIIVTNGSKKRCREKFNNIKDIKTNVCYMEDSVFDKIFNITKNEENN